MRKPLGLKDGKRRWVRTAIIAATALGLFASMRAVGPGSFGSTVTVPTGTTLTVRVARPLSSRSVHLGDAFEAQVVSTKTADGEPLLPPGVWVEGRCVAVRPGDNDGHPGYLRIALSGLRDSQGNLAPLETTTFSKWGKGPLEFGGAPGKSGPAKTVAPRASAGPPLVGAGDPSEAVVTPESPLSFVLVKPAEIKGGRAAVGSFKNLSLATSGAQV